MQIKPSLNSGIIQTRASFAVTTLPNGKTRMYVYEGHTNAGGQYSRLFRSDDVATGAPVFTDLTSNSTANPGWAWFNLCTGQCWYDQFVYSPKGYPDVVYVGGSYSYGQTVANKRGGRAVDRRGRQRDGHDVRRNGHDPPERAPSGPALPRDGSGQAVPVLRDERRRRHAIER